MDNREHVYYPPDDASIKNCARALSLFHPTSNRTSPIIIGLHALCGSRWTRVGRDWFFCDKYGIWKKLSGGQDGCWKLVGMLKQPDVQQKLIKHALEAVSEFESTIGVPPPPPVVVNGVPVAAGGDDPRSELEKVRVCYEKNSFFYLFQVLCYAKTN